MMEGMQLRRRGPRYWPVFLILGVAAVAICGGGLFALALGRRLVDRIGKQSSMGPDIISMSESPPYVKEEAKWDGDVLAVDFEFHSDKKPIDDVVLDSALLDKCLPDVKLPRHLGPIGPGKVAKLKIRFPGFEGRGSKFAKLQLSYGNSTIRTTANPDIYIPLGKMPSGDRSSR